MTNRQLSPTGDYTFGSSMGNYLINTPEAVAQAVQTRLRLIEGEWFFDITDGTPYFSGVLGKYTNDTIDQLIQGRILDTDGVSSIVNYSGLYNGENRSYTITVTIDTFYGLADVYGVF